MKCLRSSLGLNTEHTFGNVLVMYIARLDEVCLPVAQDLFRLGNALAQA